MDRNLRRRCNLYTPYSNFFIPHKPEYKLQKSIGNINAIVEYKEKLWLGTDGGLIIYNPKDESYEYCPLHVPRSVTNNEVKYIQKEGDHLFRLVFIIADYISMIGNPQHK